MPMTAMAPELGDGRQSATAAAERCEAGGKTQLAGARIVQCADDIERLLDDTVAHHPARPGWAGGRRLACVARVTKSAVMRKSPAISGIPQAE